MTKNQAAQATDNKQATQKHALVVGLGISGISSAIALHQAGWKVTIAEKASGRRKGGYFIGLFGMGRHAAQRLGAMQYMHDRRSVGKDSGNYSLNREGVTGKSLGFEDAPESIAPWLLLRGDVEEATFKALEGLPQDIEILYNTRPLEIWQNAQGVRVTLTNSATQQTAEETYDLLVGADGIHSQVRKMVFGPEEKYAHPLNTMICAFELPQNPPGLKSGQGAILTEVGKSFWVFPFKDHPATVLFTYATDKPDEERKKDPRQRLREVYGDQPYGEVMEYALNQLDVADEFIFDTTAQIKMDSWHRGRVVLVGDSAWCPSLYSGMGATTGIAGADLLGASLRKNPDNIDLALQEWEEVLRPKVEAAQKQGATSGRLNFVSFTEKELSQREKNVERGMKYIKNPLVGKLIGYTPFAKNRTADLNTLLARI